MFDYGLAGTAQVIIRQYDTPDSSGLLAGYPRGDEIILTRETQLMVYLKRMV